MTTTTPTPSRTRRTASTIEQAVDLAMAQPGEDIRVRRSWSVYYDAGLLQVRHYGTVVLSAYADGEGWGAELGAGAWGSVSDQGGVNRVLRHLGIPLFASRRNGFTLESVR